MTYELLVFCGAPKDDQLQQSGGPYLLGKDVSIVDVSCFPYAASRKRTKHSEPQNLHSLYPSFSSGVRLQESTVQTVDILNVPTGQMALLGLWFGSVQTCHDWTSSALSPTLIGMADTAARPLAAFC